MRRRETQKSTHLFRCNFAVDHLLPTPEETAALRRRRKKRNSVRKHIQKKQFFRQVSTPPVFLQSGQMKLIAKGLNFGVAESVKARRSNPRISSVSLCNERMRRQMSDERREGGDEELDDEASKKRRKKDPLHHHLQLLRPLGRDDI